MHTIETRAVNEALEDGFNEAIEVHNANNNPNINVRNASNTVDTLMEILVLEADPVDEEEAIPGIIDTDQGVLLTHSNTLVQSVARTRLRQAESESSRYFCAAWKESICEPIKLISDHISQVEVGGRPIMICPHVLPANKEEIHGLLKNGSSTPLKFTWLSV